MIITECSSDNCEESPTTFRRGAFLCVRCDDVEAQVPDWVSDRKARAIISLLAYHDQLYGGMFFTDCMVYGLQADVLRASIKSVWLGGRVLADAWDAGYRYPPINDRDAHLALVEQAIAERNRAANGSAA